MSASRHALLGDDIPPRREGDGIRRAVRYRRPATPPGDGIRSPRPMSASQGPRRPVMTSCRVDRRRQLMTSDHVDAINMTSTVDLHDWTSMLIRISMSMLIGAENRCRRRSAPGMKQQ
jgi:hypothetical protein